MARSTFPSVDGEALPHDVLQAARVHAACIALTDAAAHLRRTAILAEAATAVALRRSLAGPGDDKGWVQALDGADKAVRNATASFFDISRGALALAGEEGKAKG